MRLIGRHDSRQTSTSGSPQLAGQMLSMRLKLMGAWEKSEMVYKCEQCDAQTNTFDDLMHTAADHLEWLRYSCPLCPRLHFPSRTTVLVHFSHRHKNRPIQILETVDEVKEHQLMDMLNKSLSLSLHEWSQHRGTTLENENTKTKKTEKLNGLESAHLQSLVERLSDATEQETDQEGMHRLSHDGGEDDQAAPVLQRFDEGGNRDEQRGQQEHDVAGGDQKEHDVAGGDQQEQAAGGGRQEEAVGGDQQEEAAGGRRKRPHSANIHCLLCATPVRSTDLRQHVLSHLELDLYECTECDTRSGSLQQMMRHMADGHDTLTQSPRSLIQDQYTRLVEEIGTRCFGLLY